jgi:hypothetical protein
MEEAPDPGCELDIERLVEAERLVDAGDVGGSGGIAGDDRRRVSGAQMEQRKHKQRHHRHDRDGREDSSDDVGEHLLFPQSFATFQRNTTGATMIP